MEPNGFRLPEKDHIETSMMDGMRLTSMFLPVWKDLRGMAAASLGYIETQDERDPF